MAVAYSQNGVIVRNTDFDLSKFVVCNQEYETPSCVGNLKWSITSNNDGWFRTPNINLSQASTIEEHWEVYVASYASGGGSVASGSWWSNNTNSRNFVDVSVYPDSIRFIYGSNVVDTEPTEYTLNDKITIIKKLDANNVTVKVLLNDSLKGERTIPRTSLNLPNSNVFYHVGGLRMSNSDKYGLKGSIDFLHSYIKVNGNLFWGVETITA